MSNRSVTVNANANFSGLIAEYQRAKKATQDYTKTVSTELVKNKQEFAQLGGAMSAAGLVGATGLGVAITKFADFDQAMSYVQASTHESASNMGLLRNAAVEAGASTVFSATESANAIDELSKSGLSTADILGGALTGSLDLAAAGGLGVARAAEIASVTLKQFNLNGDQAGHVADVLAAGAGKAMGSVDDLANGLKFVGPVAASMGISLEETTGVLAMFASQGIIGEQAGTALRGMLSSLTSPSAQARGEMERLGITLYDGEGKFAGMANVAGQLTKAYSGLTPEARDASMGMLFGNETVTAARVLFAGGAEAVRGWTKDVDDAGYASETAALRLDNLIGDVEGFGGAADTAFIQTGAHANDSLRALVQTGTAFLDVYNGMPDALQGTAMNLTGIATATGLAGGAFFLAAPKVIEFRTAMATLKEEAPKTMSAVGLVGKAAAGLAGISIAVGILDTLSESIKGTGATAEELKNSLVAGSGGAKTFEVALKGIADFKLEDARKDWQSYLATVEKTPDTRGWPTFLKTFGTTSDDVRDKIGALGTELAGLDPAEANRGFQKLVEEMGGGAEATQLLLDLMPDYNNKLIEQASSLGLTADKETLLRLAMQDSAASTEEQAEGLAVLEGKAADTGDQISDLADQISNFGKATFDVNAAQRDFEAAIDSVSDSLQSQRDAYIEAHGNLDGFNASLDIGTAEGRENKANLDDIAKSALNMSSATLTQTGSQEKASQAIANGRQRLIEALGQYGITGQAAEDYANELGLIPSNIGTTVTLTGADSAKKALDGVYNAMRAIGALGGINIPVASGSGMANGGTLDFYAAGGMRESHVAQIAPAGSWRVWAEPETGGEAYIPLAASKRARSLEIWAETGRRLGVAENYRGSVSASTRSAASTTRVVENHIQIDVHPSVGMDEEALGDRIVRVVEGVLK